MPFLLRRVTALAAFALAAILSMATSRPRPPTQLSAHTEQRLTVDGTRPAASLHLTARLSAKGNVGVDGGVVAGLVRVSAFPCVVGVDSFDDAGVCVDWASSTNRPSYRLWLASDGAPDDGGCAGCDLPVLAACPPGQACDDGFTVGVRLSEGETRTVQLQLDVSAEVALDHNVAPGEEGSLSLTQP